MERKEAVVKMGSARCVSPSSRDRQRWLQTRRDEPHPGPPRNRGGGVRISWGGEAPQMSRTRWGVLEGGACPPLLRSDMRWHPPGRALVPQHVLLVLVAEVLHRRHDHPAGRVAQAAEAPAVLQALLNAVENLQVHHGAVARQDALVRAHGPVAADAAGRALPARLAGVEA